MRQGCRPITSAAAIQVKELRQSHVFKTAISKGQLTATLKSDCVIHSRVTRADNEQFLSNRKPHKAWHVGGFSRSPHPASEVQCCWGVIQAVDPGPSCLDVLGGNVQVARPVSSRRVVIESSIWHPRQSHKKSRQHRQYTGAKKDMGFLFP